MRAGDRPTTSASTAALSRARRAAKSRVTVAGDAMRDRSSTAPWTCEGVSAPSDTAPSAGKNTLTAWRSRDGCPPLPGRSSQLAVHCSSETRARPVDRGIDLEPGLLSRSPQRRLHSPFERTCSGRCVDGRRRRGSGRANGPTEGGPRRRTDVWRWSRCGVPAGRFHAIALQVGLDVGLGEQTHRPALLKGIRRSWTSLRKSRNEKIG